MSLLDGNSSHVEFLFILVLNFGGWQREGSSSLLAAGGRLGFDLYVAHFLLELLTENK
jgi:hypothetical protein